MSKNPPPTEVSDSRSDYDAPIRGNWSVPARRRSAVRFAENTLVCPIGHLSGISSRNSAAAVNLGWSLWASNRALLLESAEVSTATKSENKAGIKLKLQISGFALAAMVLAVAEAQEQLRVAPLQFDAASVKAVQPENLAPSRITADPGRLRAQSVSTDALIAYAYSVQPAQIVDLKSELKNVTLKERPTAHTPERSCV